MKTLWFVLVIAVLPLAENSFSAVGTNSMSAVLQQGLFEEEANNNLEAAIQAYKVVISQFDRDRKLAATAIYRLGECYRKQGKTNEAIAQYSRIAREFPDVGPAATLSAQNLAALGAKISARPAEPGAKPDSGIVTTDIEEAEIKRIHALVQNSPDLINAPNSSGRMPLHDAAAAGHLRVARYLLENGARVDARESKGDLSTPLLLAAAGGHKGMVDVLINQKANLEGKNSKGSTPLHLAAAWGFGAIGKALIDAGANTNAKDNDGSTPLHLAAGQGHYAFAEMLLDSKAEINARLKNRFSPLHLAAANGHTQMTSLLIKRGAEVNARAENGSTPLTRAVSFGHLETAQLLVQNKADPNLPQDDQDGTFYPLNTAVMKADGRMLTLLLQNGADPNSLNKKDNVSKSPLDLALDAKDADVIPELVLMLLQYKANPNPPTEGRNTPLMSAVTGGRQKVVELLLKNHANLNATNREGQTALHLSIPKPGIFKLILDAGANANAATLLGHTPLHWAAMSKYVSQTEELIRRGANVNARDNKGLTPLHYAVIADQGQEVVKALLAGKADPNVRDEQGYTPLDLTKGPLPYSFHYTTFSSGLIVADIGNLRFPSPTIRGVPSAQQEEAAKLLRKHGALDLLPDPNSIRISVPGKAPHVIFEKGTKDWNRFTLLEALGSAYGLLKNTFASGGPGRVLQSLSSTTSNTPWPFPDLSNVKIRRASGSPARWSIIEVNVAEILKSGECSRDLPLVWGDVIEIPELEHKFGERWAGFSLDTHKAFNKCWTRVVHVIIKDQRHDLTLSSGEAGSADLFVEQSMWLKEILLKSGLLLSSSDLSRVKVTRTDPATNDKKDFIIDCSTEKPDPRFWVRQGDVIEVPEKE